MLSYRFPPSPTIEPSAETLATHRRLASHNIDPGSITPLSTSSPNATRGWLRLSAITVMALSSNGSVSAMRRLATAT